VFFFATGDNPGGVELKHRVKTGARCEKGRARSQDPIEEVIQKKE